MTHKSTKPKTLDLPQNTNLMYKTERDLQLQTDISQRYTLAFKNVLRPAMHLRRSLNYRLKNEIVMIIESLQIAVYDFSLNKIGKEGSRA